MKTCPQCGKLYAEKLSSCPHCSGRPQAIGCLILAGLCVVGFIVWMIIGSGSGPSAPSCGDDFSKCANNADVVNHATLWTEVEADCEVEAEHEAEYGTPVWPMLPFSHYSDGDDFVKTGIATAVEPDAQFQNGFGAMVHSTVICKFDLRNHKVLSVAVEPH
jgi:hypothetical protein